MMMMKMKNPASYEHPELIIIFKTNKQNPIHMNNQWTSRKIKVDDSLFYLILFLPVFEYPEAKSWRLWTLEIESLNLLDYRERKSQALSF